MSLSLSNSRLAQLPPDPKDRSHAVPPSASAPKPRRSKHVLSVAGYYAALAGKSSRKARK